MPKKRPFVIGLPYMVQKTISYLIIYIELSHPFYSARTIRPTTVLNETLLRKLTAA